MTSLRNGAHGPEFFQRIRDGDESALELLFKAYYGPLCSFVNGFVGSTAIAEDLVQDVFASLWDRKATLVPSGSPKSFLYKVARNKALNYLKHERREGEWRERARAALDEMSAKLTHDETASRELLHALLQEVDALPERRRQVFVLSRKHGLSYREIAEALELSVKTVEVHMRLALRDLREKLKRFRDDV